MMKSTIARPKSSNSSILIPNKHNLNLSILKKNSSRDSSKDYRTIELMCKIQAK